MIESMGQQRGKDELLIATDGSDFVRPPVEEACRMLTNIGTDSIMVISAFEEQIALAAEPSRFQLNIIRTR